MGDFCAIIDNPPAPKLGPLMRLIPEKATAAELRGESLFHGKAKCATCHYGPAFADDYMHDLQVERFYKGRPEGPVKTFALRGIKDSPPYLHDGRCPTLHDSVEFFNLVLELKLTSKRRKTWSRICSACEFCDSKQIRGRSLNPAGFSDFPPLRKGG